MTTNLILEMGHQDVKVGGSDFESLDPEIQQEILLQLETPEDLRSLIKASPRFLQVFELNKAKTICTVARRQFHPVALSEALVFVELSQLEKPLQRETAITWCKIDPAQLRGWRNTTNSILESMVLCKLARDIEFFIKDFARNTLPILLMHGQYQSFEIEPQYQSEAAPAAFDLSFSEIGRLQRAFCRFEIYRCLFARCSEESGCELLDFSPNRPFGPKEQANFFLEQFPDFQVAEINCVRDYLSRRLWGVCTQMEDEALDHLSPEQLMFDPEGDVETDEWNSDFHIFLDSGKYLQNEYLEHLLSLGLPYLRTLFQSKGKKQSALFTQHITGEPYSHMEDRFITRAFEELGENPSAENVPLLAETDRPFVYKRDPTNDLDIPDAWQWANPRAPPYGLSESCYKGLRDWGYVFWDLSRLRESGMLERSAEDIWLVSFDEHKYRTRPSVQERLLKKHGLWERYNQDLSACQERILDRMRDRAGDEYDEYKIT